jgi:hypothetical protein
MDFCVRHSAGGDRFHCGSVSTFPISASDREREVHRRGVHRIPQPRCSILGDPFRAECAVVSCNDFFVAGIIRGAMAIAVASRCFVSGERNSWAARWGLVLSEAGSPDSFCHDCGDLSRLSASLHFPFSLCVTGERRLDSAEPSGVRDRSVRAHDGLVYPLPPMSPANFSSSC